MTDDGWRTECILETSGKIWRGNETNKTIKSWSYDQFSKNTSIVLLKFFNCLSRDERSSPIKVSRNMSWFCNANSGEIISGKWSAPYTGGNHPSSWTGSGEIFDCYLSTGTSAKFGQCWVFAGVLASMGRAAGIPSRPVTNFGSGHDGNNNKTIDIHLNQFGLLDPSRSDSVWNFHVWTEMWMKRFPDIGMDGWQIVDATPQEQSDGKYQCGPASRLSVKSCSGGNYDVDFVFAEVSAPVMIWQDDGRGHDNLLAAHSNMTGKILCTKNNGSDTMLDLTSEYK